MCATLYVGGRGSFALYSVADGGDADHWLMLATSLISPPISQKDQMGMVVNIPRFSKLPSEHCGWIVAHAPHLQAATPS